MFGIKKTVKNFICVSVVLLIIIPPISFNAAAEAPEISAKSAILVDSKSGRVLYEKNADEIRGMASTTKIMTSYVAIKESSKKTGSGMDELKRMIKISPEAAGIEGSSLYLKAGDELPFEDLLYATMLRSANDAAAALACAVAGSSEAFSHLMNEAAADLGLISTNFTNPHGLSDKNHYTTARELSRLTRAALQLPLFRKIVSTYKYNMADGKIVLNHNKMLRLYDGAIGVKTGFTKETGRCLVSAAEKDGFELIAVTLNAPDDWSDHTALLDWGYENWIGFHLAAKEEYYNIPVVGGLFDSVKCTPADGGYVTLPAGSVITYKVELDQFFYAPVYAGSAVGSIVFYADGDYIGENIIYAESDVIEEKQKNIWDYIKNIFYKE